MPAVLDPQLVLSAYTRGAFPMTDPDGVTRWYTADPRGVIPLDGFKTPRSLRQTIRKGLFEVVVDRDFVGTMRDCMNVEREGVRGSWISDRLIDVYRRLHEAGYAHSVECWATEDGHRLRVGGLYGVALGGAFFGESMFHSRTDASKVALAHLVERLRAGGFLLLDTQACTRHLARFGCHEIDADEYRRRLDEAMQVDADFHALDRHDG